MKNRASAFWKENKSFVLFVILMAVFRSSVADWNEVPTGSMKPTIIEGDRLLVNKLAYDIKLPFVNVSLLPLDNPVRGDIVVFESAAADKRLVKRVIGVPGDHVAMQNNVLIINGKPLTYKTVDDAENILNENLLGINHKIKVSPYLSAYASFDTITVPQGQYLVLGDNRDNSADSRLIGFVPRDEIVGRSKQVIISLNYDNYYLPRSDRFLDSL